MDVRSCELFLDVFVHTYNNSQSVLLLCTAVITLKHLCFHPFPDDVKTVGGGQTYRLPAL